jgi:membrane protease YdiL (CAAX protease family)
LTSSLELQFEKAIALIWPRPPAVVRLIWFFAATFVVAWFPWFTVIFVKGMPTRLAMIGLCAPALSALTVAWAMGGWKEVAAILSRLLRFRFKLRWWLLALLLMPAAYGVSAFATTSQDVRLLLNPNSWWFLPISFAYLLVVTAGEEIGWRGYALPLLLETRMPPIIAAIILGILWGAWHIPLRIPSGLSSFPLPLFILFTAALSVVYLILLQRSGGSLIPALLLHASTDLAPRVIDVSMLQWRFWLTVVIIVGSVATLLCASGTDPDDTTGTKSRMLTDKHPEAG